MGMAFRGIDFPSLQPSGVTMPIAQPAQQKPGFFDRKGLGVSLLGGIGDALATAGGGRATFLPLLQQERLRQQQLEDDQRQRDAAMQQWQQQQAWKLAHPDPVQPHYWETNNGSLAAVGADGRPRILYEDPTPKTTYITADNPDGTKQIIPIVNGVPQTGAAPAPSGAALPPGYAIRSPGGVAPQAPTPFGTPSRRPVR